MNYYSNNENNCCEEKNNFCDKDCNNEITDNTNSNTEETSFKNYSYENPPTDYYNSFNGYNNNYWGYYYPRNINSFGGRRNINSYYYGNNKQNINTYDKAISNIDTFKNGKNFIKTMLNVGQKYDTVRVVCDQIGTPTYTYDLARLLVDMAESEKYGYYHATNEGGYISWYDFTCEIFRQAGYQANVVPVTTAEYGLSKATRPFNSRLDKSKLVENGFEPLPTWQDALERYLKEL